jgi:hypothetical protein
MGLHSSTRRLIGTPYKRSRIASNKHRAHCGHLVKLKMWQRPDRITNLKDNVHNSADIIKKLKTN